MSVLLNIFLIVMDIYIYVVIAAAVLSWLVSFKAVDGHRPWVSMAGKLLSRLTDPVLRPVRKVLPSLGGIDLSPLFVIVLLMVIQRMFVSYIYPLVS
jgi:YggT family protein